MAFATYSEHRPDEPQIVGSVNTSKTLAKCFGYMAIGLLISAGVAFGVGALFANLIFGDYIFTGQFTDANQTAMIAYTTIMILSFIGLLIDSFVMNFTFARGKHSIWPAYIVYATLMGIFLSSFLLVGVDFVTIGSAAGVSALVFGVLFCVGYFSKKDLNFASYIGISVLSTVAMFGLFGMILFFLIPGAAFVYNIVFSVVLAIVLLIVIAADAYNVKQILQRGAVNDNLALYLAFNMYCDFIVLFIRILYVMMLFMSNRDNS